MNRIKIQPIEAVILVVCICFIPVMMYVAAHMLQNQRPEPAIQAGETLSISASDLADINPSNAPGTRIFKLAQSQYLEGCGLSIHYTAESLPNDTFKVSLQPIGLVCQGGGYNGQISVKDRIGDQTLPSTVFQESGELEFQALTKISIPRSMRLRD